MDWTKIKHFKESEFACPCCGKADMNEGHMIQLDQARDLAGVPFRINSGFRCDKHNLEVGGKVGSSHVKGFASDIRADNSADRFLILRALIVVGFRRIGIAKTFIHVDNDPDKDQHVAWLY